MGVEHLWTLLSPSGRPITLSSLSNQRVAIDVSIWLLHIIHGYISLGYKDFSNIHLISIFHRLCKLLSHNIKPVFVFDGKAPDLKRKTVLLRQQMRENRKINLKKLAENFIIKKLENKIKNNTNQNDSESSTSEILEQDLSNSLKVLDPELNWQLENNANLKEYGVNVEEFYSWDFVRQTDFLRMMKHKEIEKKQKKFEGIGNKEEFSKIQVEDYLQYVKKKNEIEKKKNENLHLKNENEKNLLLQQNNNLTKNSDVLTEYFKNIENKKVLVGSSLNDKTKGFLLIKNTDQQVDKLKNMMLKIPKQKKRNRLEKIIDFEQKYNNLIQEKEDQQSEILQDEEIQPKIKEKDVIPEDITNYEPQPDFSNNNQQNEDFKESIQIVKTEKIDLPYKKEITKEKSIEKIEEKLLISENIEEKSLQKVNELFEISSPALDKTFELSSPTSSSLPITNYNSTSHPSSKRKIIPESAIMEELEHINNAENLTLYEIEQEYNKYINLNNLDSESLQDKFTSIKSLLTLFGMPWVESPGEAEAQCAFLEKIGLVDGIITEDSDVFLFGGRNVYRNLFKKDSQIQSFSMKNIEKELCLTQEKLIHLALFLGSDYTIGIKGVGIVNSMEIVNAFENYDSLVRFKNWAIHADVLLEDKWEHYKNIPLKELQYKNFHKNYKKHWEIPDDFPNSLVIDAYNNPNLDNSKEKFVWGTPDIEKIRTFVKENFKWENEEIDQNCKEIEKFIKINKEINNQSKIPDFFSKDETIATIQSKRIKAAIKGLKDVDILKENEQNNNNEISIIRENNVSVFNLINSVNKKIDKKRKKDLNSDEYPELNEFEFKRTKFN